MYLIYLLHILFILSFRDICGLSDDSCRFSDSSNREQYETPLSDKLSDTNVSGSRESGTLIDNNILNIVTREDGAYIHRFSDSSPVSPSGRYLAVTQVAEQYDILEKAIVTVFDLEMKVKDKGFGGSRIVAETAAYGSQLGAQVQWGATDEQLIYNLSLIHI